MYNTPIHTLHHESRADNTSSKNSRATTIAIAVVVSVCGIAIILFLWRGIVRHIRRSKPAPLPPVQPLVHQREHQLAAFTEQKEGSRHSTWNMSSVASRSHLNPIASDTSLLPPGDPRHGPIRQSSFQTETADGSEDLADGASLPHPNPSFYSPSPHNSESTASLESAGETGDPSAFSTSPSSSSALSPSTSASSSQPFARPHPRSQSRPFSLLSTATSHSGSRMTVIRGAPHGPHSNVQIVLPAPLAPEVYPYMVAEDVNGRKVVIDGEGGSDRTSQYGLTDSYPVETLPTRLPLRVLRHSTSSSMYSESTTATRHPPVPRIPSVYSQEILHSDKSLPAVSSQELTTSSRSSFHPSDSPRKLQKRRSASSPGQHALPQEVKASGGS
ncbi:hypothetical protein EW146_g3925 [Bondarzewia mesenterica]|uniref:Uncharacterized protein n=1 Tax=Bondarzewia mesenterica TaxID=1095465 RepID=A0A4S4LX47_9AGAM|nr:hypothetical protein EW146_g3925 [Bondarzewia mesenterica]